MRADPLTAQDLRPPEHTRPMTRRHIEERSAADATDSMERLRDEQHRSPLQALP